MCYFRLYTQYPNTDRGCFAEFLRLDQEKGSGLHKGRKLMEIKETTPDKGISTH